MGDKSTDTGSQIPRAISRADLYPILALIFLVLVVYHPMFSGKPAMPDTWKRFEPWNTELGYDGPLDPRITNANNDAILLYIPWNKFAHEELNKGNIPAWDPYCLGGVPLASNHLVPVFHPLYALIAWLASPLFIMGISGMIHTLIMAFFFYLFMREFLGGDGKARIPAWMSASFLIVSMLPNPHYQPWPMTMAWFPAIWFFYERWLKHRSIWSGLWMALCWAGPLLAGYPSLFIQFTIFTLVWFLVRPNMLPQNERPSMKSRIWIFVWPFIIALGLSVVQNLPTILASRESDRSIFKSVEDLQREAAFTIPPDQPWQTHVKRLLQPMLPIKFPGNDFFNRGYIGALPVILALFGFGYWRRKNFPRPAAWMALIIAPFALVPAVNFAVYAITGGVLIDPNPPLEVFGFLVLMMAGVGAAYLIICETPDGNIKQPEDMSNGAILASISMLIMFAGYYAIDEKSMLPSGFIRYILMGSVPVIIFSGILIRIKCFERKLPFLLVLICVTFLLSAISMGKGVLAPYEPNDIGRDPMPVTETIAKMQQMVDPSQGGEWGRIIRYSDKPVNVMSLGDQPYTFYPNLGTYFHIPDAFGYYNLAPKHLMDIYRDIQSEAVVENRGIVAFSPPVDVTDLRLMALGVRYVLSDVELPGLELLFKTGEDFYVYKINNPGIVGNVETKYVMPGLLVGWIITGLFVIIWLIVAYRFAMRGTRIAP